jgi:hypothetical protein
LFFSKCEEKRRMRRRKRRRAIRQHLGERRRGGDERRAVDTHTQHIQQPVQVCEKKRGAESK